MTPTQPFSPGAGVAGRRERFFRDANRSTLILHRVRLVLAMATSFIVVTTAFALPAGEMRPALLFTLKAGSLGLVTLAYVLSRWSRTQPYATGFAWAVGAAFCAGFSLTGIVTGDSHAAMIFCVGTALMTATLFPWGVRPQLATTLWTGAAIAVALCFTSPTIDVPASYQADAAAAFTLAVSILIAYERQTSWRTMRVENNARVLAEASTAELHRHLERLVSERTASLETTRRDLERQIVDHHATLQMLREKEQQLRDIVDNSSSLIFVKDLQGRYRFMGLQFERLFQRPRDQMIGKTVADLFAPEVAAAVAANERRVLSTNQPLETEDSMAGPDGVSTFLTLRFPLRDAAGLPYGLCGIATDISQRKQMEVELRRTEALLSSVIESSNEAIWSLDRDYRFTALNSAVRETFLELFGTRPEVGASLDDCLPPRMRASWRERYEQALLGQHLDVEHVLAGEGRPRHVLVSLNPVGDESAVTGVVVFTKEITSVKRAEEELLQHQAELAHALRLRTIGEMATGLVQHLRRPLIAIERAAHDCREAIESSHFDPVSFAHRVGQVTTEALGGAESLRHLRRLVRKHDSTRGSVDVNDVARNAARIVVAQHPDTALQLALAPHLPLAYGDGIQLEQVVLNLLLNAVDALQAVPADARTLAVQTTLVDGSAVEVAVQDTGSGLDPAIGNNLFSSFVSSKPKGLGMGLAISRSIVEAHGGRIWMTPNPRGGSIFHFTVPLP